MKIRKRLQALESKRTPAQDARPYAHLSDEQLRAIIGNTPDEIPSIYTHMSNAELIAIAKDDR